MFGKKDEKRFEVIYEQGITNVVKILVDKETGVHYLFNSVGQGGGLTPLLDRSRNVVVNSSAIERD